MHHFKLPEDLSRHPEGHCGCCAGRNQGQAHWLLWLIPHLTCMRTQETAPTFVLMHGLVYVFSFMHIILYPHICALSIYNHCVWHCMLIHFYKWKSTIYLNQNKTLKVFKLIINTKEHTDPSIVVTDWTGISLLYNIIIHLISGLYL